MSSASSDHTIRHVKRITVKPPASGPWTATKHTNKGPLCPRPPLRVAASNHKPSPTSRKAADRVQRTREWTNLRSAPRHPPKTAVFQTPARRYAVTKCQAGASGAAGRSSAVSPSYQQRVNSGLIGPVIQSSDDVAVNETATQPQPSWDGGG